MIVVMEGRKLEESEIQHLLKNLMEVLQLYTVPEFNNFLITAINKKGDTHSAEKYILELVCETYKISYRALVFSKSNQNVTIPRQVAFCLLHYTLGLSTRYIAKTIFHFEHHSTVGSAIKMYKNLNPNLKPDKELMQSIDALREKVVAKMQKTE